MARNYSRLGLIAMALAAGPCLLAQTTTTGGVNGMLTDKSGAPLEGATIRLASGQIVRNLTSSAEGRFSVGLLNPGTWTVTVSKAGYLTVHQTISVSINSMTTANFKLPKEGGATVEVVATASVVDTSATTTGSTYSVDSIASVPKGRDISEMAYMTPGVSTSGFGSDNGLQISIAGASGAENSFSIDGLKTNDMRYGGQGVAMINEFVDQVDVQTGGYKPEYSAMGGMFNVLTKSGSNEFAGSTWLTLTPNTLKPNPKQNTFYAEGKAESVYDMGAWVGGAFIRDKFFYSVGINYQLTQAPSYNNLSNLTVASTRTPNYQYFGKFQYYLNTENQLTLSYFGNDQTATQGTTNLPSTFVDGRGDANVGGDTVNNTSNFNLIWDATLTPSMNLTVRAGQSKIDYEIKPSDLRSEILDYTYYNGGVGTGQAPVGTRWATGGGGDVDKEVNKTTQFSGDLSWVIGDHGLKFGYSYLKSNYTENEHRTGGQVWYIKWEDQDNHIYRAGQRIYIDNSEANADFQAVYAQDTWQVNKGLNVFFGFRMEQQNQKGADGNSFMKFTFGQYIQPRLGFTWDVLGNGASKVSGSYAIYYEQIPQRMAIRTFGHETYIQKNYGDNNTSTASYDPVTHQVTVSGTPDISDYSTGWSHDPIEDNIKLPKRMEIQLGYDQQVSQSTTLGMHLHYRKLTDPIEDGEITDHDGYALDPADPGSLAQGASDTGLGQAILWNPRSHGVTWTSPFNGQKVRVDGTLYPEAYNEYKAVDFSYTYKTASDMLFVGYTLSRTYGTYEGVISPTNGQADGNITASFDFWPYVGTGRLATDHPHQIKVYGYHRFEMGKNALTVGFNFLGQSGSPYSLQDDGSSSTPKLPDPGYYGNADFQDLKMGNKGRTPFLTKLDLNLSYEMQLTPKVKLEPLVEIYNLFNARPATLVEQQAMDQTGTPYAAGKWSSPSSYQAPRSVRFGAKLRF